MKLKDRALIKYFSAKNITEETLAQKQDLLLVDLISNPQMDLDEVVSVFRAFPSSFSTIQIVANQPEKIEKLVNALPAEKKIVLSGVGKAVLKELDPEVGKRVEELFLDAQDRYSELMDIGIIISKFPHISKIKYPFLLDENVTDLSQITFLLERSCMLDLSPRRIQEYQDYCSQQNFIVHVILDSQKVYYRDALEKQSDDQKVFCVGAELKNAKEHASYIANLQGKTAVLMASSMVDIPLKVAEELQQAGVNGMIRLASYDNFGNQQEDYTIAEYVAMYKRMEELISDMDENLSEEEKFGQIYQRLLGYLEYDYAAAYPVGRKEQEYAKQNENNHQNLKNGLLYGKCTHQGYVSILKNACLLKGIACEIVQGPVDSLENKDSYLMKKKAERNEIVFADEKSVITRGYHAWNKVRLNGNWYNCDPTMDKEAISNGRVPKFALLSDEVYRKLGRPTVEVPSHPCKADLFGTEKNKIFQGLTPSEMLVASNRVMEFESTVDEYGKPREFPAIPKVFPWTRIINKLKKFAREQQAHVKGFMQRVKERKEPDFVKTEVHEKIVTGEGKVQTSEEKGPVWELSSAALQTVKEEQKKISDTRDNKELEQAVTKESEIGD